MAHKRLNRLKNMDKDFARDIEHVSMISESKMIKHNHRDFIKYLMPTPVMHYAVYREYNILDIGQRNTLTERIEQHFNISIDSTSGDLDTNPTCPEKKYHVVFFSNVIEHLFNPLFCLTWINKILVNDGILIIDTPIKPHWITWSRDHFHELDYYRFEKLVERAGFEIIDFEHFYTYRPFRLKSFFGIRPFLSMFYKRHGMFQLIKKENINKTPYPKI